MNTAQRSLSLFHVVVPMRHIQWACNSHRRRIALVLVCLLGFGNIPQVFSLEPVCELNTPSGYCNDTELEATWVDLPPPLPPSQALYPFGTYERPFASNSLWNSRPRQVKWSDVAIPPAQYFPKVGNGSFSTTAFIALPTDKAQRVYPPPGRPGVWDPDAEAHLPYVDIAKWPVATIPAEGSDGHADIVDPAAGVIHSFFQLRKVDGRWTATQYAWTRLDGRGWGNGAHYFQGSRASAVPSIAGVIRKHEINDGAPQYYHALAMSLTFNAMSPEVQYVYPATSGDTTYKANEGRIPMGALLMLPPDFNTSSITSQPLRKVANTLKTYGAYVVDRNYGTPFYVYVENGVAYDLHEGKWNNSVATDLVRIREALRPVAQARDWVNGVELSATRPAPLNLISMRGPWSPLKGNTVKPTYDSKTQRLVFGPTQKNETAENLSSRSFSGVTWAKPVPGRLYEFKVESPQGGRAYLRYWSNGVEQFNTRPIRHGETFRLIWPSVEGVPILGVISGIGNRTEIRATFTEVVQ